MTARTAVGGRAEGPMLTPPPPEAPTGMFRGGLPVQNLVGAAVRELQVSMLDADVAVRLGGTSHQPRYYGTALPPPTQQWLSTAPVNTEDQVASAVVNAGNAPSMMNKRAAQGSEAPEEARIARNLPRRRR